MTKKMTKVDVMKCMLIKEAEVKYEIHSSDSVADIMKAMGVCDSAEEYLYLFCLNTRGQVVGLHEVAHGELNSCIVHPREIFKRALLNNAAGIIVSHNHPSGDPTPSGEDDNTTTRLKQAGELLGIKLVDHVIVGDGKNYSYAFNGRL